MKAKSPTLTWEITVMFKQIPLSILAVMAVLLFQNCKKSSTDDTSATTTYKLQATVNGTTWTPDTLSANITYNAGAKTKVFNFTGTYNQRRLACAVTLNNADNTNSFPLVSYTVDANTNPLMTYSLQQKDANGNYVFLPVTTAGLNEGLITVSAVDAATGLVSGTFSFSTKRPVYDTDGNIIAINNTVVSGGTFTNMPYMFISR